MDSILPQITSQLIVVGVVDFLSKNHGWKIAPSRHASVSIDCPLYHSLKQAPVWGHACSGHLELIHERPTRGQWEQHILSKHLPLILALKDVAYKISDHHLIVNEATTEDSASPQCNLNAPRNLILDWSCPFGCTNNKTVDKDYLDTMAPGNQHGHMTNDTTAWQANSATSISLADSATSISLADRRMAAIKAESAVLYNSTQSQLNHAYFSSPLDSRPGAHPAAHPSQHYFNEVQGPSTHLPHSALRDPLTHHLISSHLPEIQFILSYAHELSHFACTPALMGSHGLLSLSLQNTEKPAGLPPTSGMPLRISPLRENGLCPFTAFDSVRRKLHKNSDPLATSQTENDELSNSKAEAKVVEWDVEVADLDLSTCDGARHCFVRGNEEAAVEHLLSYHMEDLLLAAGFTSKSCREAFQRTASPISAEMPGVRALVPRGTDVEKHQYPSHTYLAHCHQQGCQVSCTSLPWALLHQSVMHPIKLLKTPFRRMRRKEQEVGWAPLACPMTSSCTCHVKTSARLSRHVGMSHGPALSHLAEAIAKLAPVTGTKSTSSDISLQATNTGTLILGGNPASEPLHPKPEAGVCEISATPKFEEGMAHVHFSCSCCSLLASGIQLGLPIILDWGYEQWRVGPERHQGSAPSASDSSGSEKGLFLPTAAQGLDFHGVKEEVNHQGRRASSSSVAASDTSSSASMLSPSWNDLAMMQYSSWKELEAHIQCRHEDLLLALAAYVSCLGSGWEGAPCPLAAVSSQIQAEKRVTSRQHVSSGDGSTGRSSTGPGSVLGSAVSEMSKGRIIREGRLDLGGSCSGTGHFIFDNIEMLLEHCADVHLEHLLKVLGLAIITVTTTNINQKLRCPFSCDAAQGRMFRDPFSVLLHVMRVHGDSLHVMRVHGDSLHVMRVHGDSLRRTATQSIERTATHSHAHNRCSFKVAGNLFSKDSISRA